MSLYLSTVRRKWTPMASAICLLAMPSLSAQTVIIDAGHGGSQPGATYFGLSEKQLTFDVSQRLANVLHRQGYRVLMTRQGDRDLSLSERRNLGAYDPSALFVSVHFNASPNASASGLEAFYYSSASRAFAEGTLRHMARATGLAARGVHSRGLGVLKGNQARASILVECGFLSNPVESRACANPAFRQQLAYAIAAGVHDASRGSRASFAARGNRGAVPMALAMNGSRGGRW